eukprot:1143275-Pelagomonas_calceolata.AAC.2
MLEPGAPSGKAKDQEPAETCLVTDFAAAFCDTKSSPKTAAEQRALMYTREQGSARLVHLFSDV